MQLVLEYCCAQGEAGDGHVMFSVHTYTFVCMGAADLPNKKLLHLICKKNSEVLTTFLLKISWYQKHKGEYSSLKFPC